MHFFPALLERCACPALSWGGLSVLLRLLPESPGVRCLWAMQEGTLHASPRHPHPGAWGRPVKGGDPAEGTCGDSQADWGNSGRGGSGRLCTGEGKVSREKLRAPEAPGLGREGWLHLPVQSMARSAGHSPRVQLLHSCS